MYDVWLYFTDNQKKKEKFEKKREEKNCYTWFYN